MVVRDRFNLWSLNREHRFAWGSGTPLFVEARPRVPSSTSSSTHHSLLCHYMNQNSSLVMHPNYYVVVKVGLWRVGAVLPDDLHSFLHHHYVQTGHLAPLHLSFIPHRYSIWVCSSQQGISLPVSLHLPSLLLSLGNMLLFLGLYQMVTKTTIIILTFWHTWCWYNLI